MQLPSTQTPGFQFGSVLLIALIVFILPVEALGASTSERIESSFGWKVSNFFDDIRVAFITDPEEKSEALALQAEKHQQVIEQLASENKPVPNDIVERIEQKKTEAREVLLETEKKCLLPPCFEATEKILDRLEDVDEANQIRLLVNDFNQLRFDIRTENLSDEVIEVRTNELNSKVNSLELVDENCNTRIDTANLVNVDSPYAELQKLCPILQNHSLEDAKKRLAVVGSDIE